MDLTFGPIAAVFTALAALLAVACVMLARKRARTIERMSVPALRDLVSDLRKLAPDQRVAELLQRAQAETWEHRLAEEVHNAPAGAERVNAANDVLFDLEHELDVGKVWATTAVRLALAGTALLGLAAYLLKGGPIALAATLIIGFAGGAFAFFLGEQGNERAKARREAFDALVKAVLPEEVAASRPQRSWRRDRAR